MLSVNFISNLLRYSQSDKSIVVGSPTNDLALIVICLMSWFFAKDCICRMILRLTMQSSANSIEYELGRLAITIDNAE